MINLDRMILEVPDFQLFRGASDAKENLRTAYDLALLAGGLPGSHKEPVGEMFKRVGEFCDGYSDTLDQLINGVYDRAGLIGGVTGPATYGDFKYLPKPDALELFFLMLARVEVENLKADLISEMKAKERPDSVKAEFESPTEPIH